MSGRLPSCTAAEVARALEHAGFVAVHQKGSHRYFADRITGEVLTTVPMHPGDIARSLLNTRTGVSRELGHKSSSASPTLPSGFRPNADTSRPIANGRQAPIA